MVELQYSEMTGDSHGTHLSDIPRGSARSAAREMARLFRQVSQGCGQPQVQGDDLGKVARLMWEQAHGIELARCP
ncbi:hypothetical protein ACTMTI_47990 [Nonomuraea sp. H19]|uniref:hypothetical protein n=1 Tax=Nonomuraea sp. H19 TaxID=3452206 RepID=UPI003F890A36